MADDDLHTEGHTIQPPLANTSAPRDLEPSPEDLQRLKKWHEERLAKKLKGEYETVHSRIGELINDNLLTPTRIDAVRLEGAARTRQSFLDWLVKPHLLVCNEERSLASVLRATRNITQTLLEADIFAGMEPRIERARSAVASPDDVDIIYRVKEKSSYYIKTATEVSGQESSVSLQGALRNAFGGAETIEASFSSGLKTRLAGNFTLSAPLDQTLRTRGELSVFGLEKDFNYFASCVEGTRGFRASLRSFKDFSLHEIAYEAALRHIRDLGPDASLSIREAAGYSLKSSLSHTWSYDSRNDRMISSSGLLFRTSQELAGLGGDVAFYKTQANFQVARPLTSHAIISLSGKTGLLYAFGPRPPAFSDKFQLGGPLDVRMIKQNGLGPRDRNDSLGGDLYWAAGLSLITSLPLKPHWPVKTHFFLNAGRLDNLDRNQDLLENVKSTLSRPTVTAGVGLLYRLDIARVEINLGVPLIANKSDAHRRGFQLGIGLEFL